MKRSALLGGLLLAGCATDGAPRPMAHTAPPAIPLAGGLDRVMGQSAPALIALLGQPAADVREGDARKLQFGNATCVLDTYLYPKSHGEPTVTYLDARQTDGSPIDRASCVGALTAGKGRRK